jgi:hypothetical protein
MRGVRPVSERSELTMSTERGSARTKSVAETQ